MASIRVKLDTRRADGKGNYPVKITITHNQTNAAISLNCFLPQKAWTGDGLERPVKTSYPGAKIINDQIQSLYIEIRKTVSDLELSGWTKHAKAIDIKNRILNDRAATAESVVFYTDFAKRYADLCKRPKTRESHLYTVEKLRAYFGHDDIRFEKITPQELRGIDTFLSENKSGANTRAIHFRNIRTIFNRAIDDDVINQDLYPFRKFKFKGSEKDKVNLTPSQIKKLYEYPFKTPALRMARDFWMLSFFLCGINPIDLYHLKKPDSAGRISFVRSKMQSGSHSTIHMLIQPEAAEIIDRYKGDENSQYLLNFIDKYVSYDVFKSFVSKKIRDIKDIKTMEEFAGLTLYHARYSWATIADSLDIPEKTISKGLGHVDKSMAGRKYIAFDWSKVDRANRQVINYVLRSHD